MTIVKFRAEHGPIQDVADSPGSSTDGA